MITGAMYCSRMALAAVVVLLAMTKSNMVAQLARAAATWGKEKWICGRLSHTKMTRAAIRLRLPAMAKGCQSTTLMNRPAVLQRKAVATTASTPAA